MGAARFNRGLAGWLALPTALVAGACKGESITDRDPDAVFGTAVVEVRTYGVDLDPDGYTVDVRGLEQHNVPSAGQVDLRVLAGPARLTLSGLAPNCHLAGEPERVVHVDPAVQAKATYVVTCGSGSQHLVFGSTRNGQTDLFVMHDGSSTPVQITNDLWRDSDPVWSPDGTRIAYATLSPDSNTSQVAIVDLDGNRVATIGATGSHAEYPAWSPSDDRIAFVSDETGNFELYVMSADGSTITQLTNTPEDELRPAWSPDGARLIYDVDVADTTLKRDLFIINADGSGKHQLATGGEYNFHAAWSPEGDRIAFVSQRDGNEEIYLVQSDGSGLQRLTTNGAGDASPSWTADGKSIIFASRRTGFFNLYRRMVPGSETLTVTNNDFEDIDPAISR